MSLTDQILSCTAQLEKRLAQESAQSSRHLAKAHQLEDALAAATLEKGVLEDVQKESSTAVQNLQHELDLLEKSSASERASSNAEKVQLQGLYTMSFSSFCFLCSW